MFAEKSNERNCRLMVCIPVFNDWTSAEKLLALLDAAASGLQCSSVSVCFIDDGSTEPAPTVLASAPSRLASVEIIHLRRNVGHQRAIALGLTDIYVNHPCEVVAVMDGDGEDLPSDLQYLLDRCRQQGFGKIVFAQRAKRTEGIVFRLGYAGFKVLHYLLTGLAVEVGNFSVIPYPVLARLVGVSELWNHYAAAVFHARLPMDKLPIARGKRLAGRSQMNLTSLVTHGLSAISVYGETVAVRLLVIVSGLMAVTLPGLATAVGIRVFTDLAIPGWATYTTGILTIVLLNLLLLTIVLVLFMLQSRNKSNFIPLRDWEPFILKRTVLYE